METIYNETSESLDSNISIYEDLGGFFTKIFYDNQNISIIIYDIELLNRIRYEIKISLKELYKEADIFNQKTIKEIYEIFIKLINQNSYKITCDNYSNIIFSLIINDSNNIVKEISFMSQNRIKDISIEYIEVLEKK